MGQTSNDEEASYFAAAAGRPAHALWGKARALEGADSPAHPLVFHMLDVASVAERLLDDILPSGTTDRLLGALAMPRAAARAWIVLCVALHDLGKATPAFQMKWAPAHAPLAALGFDLAPPRDPLDHGTIGVSLAAQALGGLGVERMLAHRLARAVAAHHGSFATDAQADVRQRSKAEFGRNAVWPEARASIAGSFADRFGVRALEPPALVRANDWAFFSALAGLTSVADWVGSMAEVFVYERPGDLDAYGARSRARAEQALRVVGFRAASTPSAASFEELFGFSPRPLQVATIALVDERDEPFCAVVEAPMGEGKTEAALYVAHALGARGQHDGTYLGLPTQATANQMFDRLASFLERTRPDQRINLQLVHGEAVFDARVRGLLRAVYAEGDGLVCESWFLGKKRALLAPFGAGTIDQALLSVMQTRHAFVRQLGLAAKTVVFDEVHAYDTYTSTLLDRLVAWLGALGATVVILSATLPATRRRALLAAFAGEQPRTELTPPPYPRITWATRVAAGAVPVALGRPASTVHLAWEDDDEVGCVARVLEQVARGGCIGVLRNSVKRAQSTYRLLLAARADGTLPAGTELLLLHARFPVEDRRRLEQVLVARLGRTGARPSRMIVVGTQVLEQSLDVDFDLLVTDLAPVDLILQRAGRLHRHDRAARPVGAERPVVRVVAPQSDPTSCDLRGVGAVYEPYVLRRSLLLLRDRTEVALPTDIEPLVEALYGQEPDAFPGKLQAERDAFVRERADDELLAKDRVWPSPQVTDDPFAALHAWFEEDNPGLAKLLRADTRLGDDSAEIVCLFGDPDDAYLDEARTSRIDLQREPSREVVRRLAQRTVRVATRGLVPAICKLPPMQNWRSIAVLARRRAVFFDGAPVVIGDFSLQLDRELGLVIDRS